MQSFERKGKGPEQLGQGTVDVESHAFTAVVGKLQLSKSSGESGSCGTDSSWRHQY